MSSPQVPFNFIPIEPSFTDALNLLKKDILLNLNSHHVGTVQSFDADNQTCTATINYPKTYFELNSVTGLYQPVLVNYPLMVDCPVMSLGGGLAALTMPVKIGDECLVLFNDRDLDNWFQGGAGAAVATPRLHSFSDAIILVGLRSLGNVLSNFDLARGVLRGGSAVVGVNTVNSKVLISNASPSGSDGSYTYGTTLNTLLQNLMTQNENLANACAAITVVAGTFNAPAGGGPVTGISGVPVNAVTISTCATQIMSIATEIGALLE